MPYFQGQQRFEGDPGFFSFIGKALGTVGRAVGILPPAAPQALPPPTTIQPPVQQRRGQIQLQFPPVVPNPLIRFTGTTTRGAPALAPPQPMAAGMGCPRGFHPNKSSYHLRDGTFVPKGSRCVRNRRTNPGNARATRRAVRRLKSFHTLSKRTEKELRRLAPPRRRRSS